jgi:hypothetical protein
MALILLALWVAGVSFYLFVFVHFVLDEKRNRMSSSSGTRPTVIRPKRKVPKAHLDEPDGFKKGENFHAKDHIVH